MTKTNPSKKAGRNRRTLPSRQRTYRRLHVRVDQLEDVIGHYYNAINELRWRVSTLEKKLEPLAKDVVAEAATASEDRLNIRHNTRPLWQLERLRGRPKPALV